MVIKLWFGNIIKMLTEEAYRNLIRELIDGGITYREAIKTANRIFPERGRI